MEETDDGPDEGEKEHDTHHQTGQGESLVCLGGEGGVPVYVCVYGCVCVYT